MGMVNYGWCPMCSMAYRMCPHTQDDIEKHLSTQEATMRTHINEELSKRIVTSNMTMFYCFMCGLVYAFDLNQIRKHGLKEVGDRHCVCGAENLVGMGDSE